MSKTASHKELDSTTKRNSSIVRYDIDFFALHNGINFFLSDVFNLSQLSEIPKTSFRKEFKVHVIQRIHTESRFIFFLH